MAGLLGAGRKRETSGQRQLLQGESSHSYILSDVQTLITHCHAFYGNEKPEQGGLSTAVFSANESECQHVSLTALQCIYVYSNVK